jgi:hypothetical protein
MPKEAFYTWSGPEPHRKIFEIRWAKETDVDPAKTVIYLPPPPEDSPDGVFEMIGNGGDVTELDRLIAALKRAKRAMLGTSTGVDAVVDSLSEVEDSAARKVRKLNSEATGTLSDEQVTRLHAAYDEYDQIVDERRGMSDTE